MPMIEVRTVVGTVLACVLWAAPARAQASVEVTHAFAGLPGSPTSRLLQASYGLFYGTLREGGPLGAGVVFVAFVSPADRLVTIPLHVFDGSDGRGPTAGLIQGSDGAFYGTTLAGGAADRGTIFRITAQGRFTALHSFSGGDGAYPFAGLIEAEDGTLYGTTSAGGTADLGTIFKGTVAGGFTTVHSFTGPEGANPLGALVQATDGNFYGVARMGGFGFGTVFRLTAAGAVQVLHQFDGATVEGRFPVAGLIQGQDGSLYGTTAGSGGTFTLASAFRITLSGVLTVLVEFYHTDMGPPAGGVIQGQDGALYGVAVGHFPGRGAIFRIGAGGVSVLHIFNGADGGEPVGGLMQASDGNLYGLTVAGGAADRGSAFRITTAGLFKSLGSFRGQAGDAPSGGVIRASDGNFYGTTISGGASNRGTVFRLSGDGELTQLHVFTGPDGASPRSGVLQARNGLLYGITSEGGAHDRGTVFVMALGGAFQTLHSFSEAESSVLSAVSPLIQGRDGALYGITDSAFIFHPAVAFRVTPSGVFTALAAIPDARGPLVEAADGNLYGTTSPLPFFPGPQGSVFRLTPAGVVTTVAQFLCDTPTGPCPHGAGPAGGLVAADDGALYGVTTTGLPAIQPTVFRVDENGLAVVAHLNKDEFPSSRLVQAADGRFYGTAAVGEGFSGSAVYSVSGDGELATVHVFSAAEGSLLAGPLLEAEPGVFYGTARQGGATRHGVVYRLTVAPGPP